jgi:hypothetical protein
MTKFKTLTAIAILSAAIAAPAFAQTEGAIGPGSRNGLTPQPGATHHMRGHHHWMGFRHSMASMDRTNRSRPGGQSIARKPSGS